MMASCVYRKDINMKAKTTKRKQAYKDATVNEIAQRILGIDTLQTRKSDSLDFHDVAVWNIKEALEAAFEAGRKADQ
tara:strand:+ start:396 stop:626 length:231 start_codon:yes stop_codon:yes gene_type:complete